MNKRRGIFVDDKLWAAIQKAAKKDGRKGADWIRRALAAALKPDDSQTHIAAHLKALKSTR